jgi:hypothetical protein
MRQVFLVSGLRVALCSFAFTAHLAFAQTEFTDHFDQPSANFYSNNVGDGNIHSRFIQIKPGIGTLKIDATEDTHNVWWSAVERVVSENLDLGLLQQPDYALYGEARVRISHAPRRVNMRFQTQRTTDFHINLMEFDLPTANEWHTISFTVTGMDVLPSDNLILSTAFIDGGEETYEVDYDYLKVKIVKDAQRLKNTDHHCPFKPSISDLANAKNALVVNSDSMINANLPNKNYNEFQSREGEPVVSLDENNLVLLGWDFSGLDKQYVPQKAILALTTHSAKQIKDDNLEELGRIRVVEVIGKDNPWDEKTVTYKSFMEDKPPSDVINPQMIVDHRVSAQLGSTTYLTICKPVLERLISGQAKGIAIEPLGEANVDFFSSESPNPEYSPMLYLF